MTTTADTPPLTGEDTIERDILELKEAFNRTLFTTGNFGALARLLAELESRTDDPQWDATDAVHPAWWRGHDFTAKEFARIVTGWLQSEGLDDDGNMQPELQAIREQIKRLLAELERVKGEMSTPPCKKCGGDHLFDTSVSSSLWNDVIRGNGHPDYLCLSCIVRVFAEKNKEFSARLYGEEFTGIFELYFGNYPSQLSVLEKQLAAMQEENARLQDYISQVEMELLEAESEGLKVWRSKDDDDDFVAIRESLPTVSGIGWTRTGAFMHLAAAATLALQTAGDEIADLRAKLQAAERERDKARARVNDFIQACLNRWNLEWAFGPTRPAQALIDGVLRANGIEFDFVANKPITKNSLESRLAALESELAAARGKAEDFAEVLLEECAIENYGGWEKFYSSTIGAEWIEKATAYLVIIGKLEKHPTENWYRWSSQAAKDGNE